MTNEAVVSGSPEETVRVETTELVCASGWVTVEAMTSASPGERVRVGVTILVSVPELVTCDVTTPGTPGKITVVGTDKLTLVSGLLVTGYMELDSLWGKSCTVLETGVLVSAE